MRNVTIKFNI